MHKIKLNQINMETTKTIKIPNPSEELVAFINKAHQKKNEQLATMRERFFKAQSSKN